MKLIVTAAVLVLISCGGAEEEEAASVPEDVSYEFTPGMDSAGVSDAVEVPPDSVIHVPAGDGFTIALDANPTTGYHWELEQIEQRENVVEQSGEPEYLQDAHEEGMVGVGGTEIWSFRSIAAGEAVIHFAYYAPGAESGDSPGRTGTFRIVCE